MNKIFWVFLILLLLIGIGIVGYFVIGNLSFPNRQAATVETPRPFLPAPTPTSFPTVSQTNKYFSQDLVKGGKNFTIQGYIEAVDYDSRVVNGVGYTRVIGIIGTSGVLTKIWLTEDQYQGISDNLWKLKYEYFQVVLTITSQSISLQQVQ